MSCGTPVDTEDFAEVLKEAFKRDLNLRQLGQFLDDRRIETGAWERLTNPGLFLEWLNKAKGFVGRRTLAGANAMSFRTNCMERQLKFLLYLEDLRTDYHALLKARAGELFYEESLLPRMTAGSGGIHTKQYDLQYKDTEASCLIYQN